jgi:hypothetical protein
MNTARHILESSARDSRIAALEGVSPCQMACASFVTFIPSGALAAPVKQD